MGQSLEPLAQVHSITRKRTELPIMREKYSALIEVPQRILRISGAFQ